MNKIYFATTNKDKLKEAEEILKLKIQGIELDINEIQSLDIEKVAVKKALDYFEKVKRPLFVEDVSLTFKSLGNLPGTYINDFLKSLDNEGLIALLKNAKDRRAVAETCIVYVANGQTYPFHGIVEGEISLKSKGDHGFGWDKIFLPKGEKKTFAQMLPEEKNRYSMRSKALNKFKKWLLKSGELKEIQKNFLLA